MLKFFLVEKVKHWSVNLVSREEEWMHEVVDMVEKAIVGIY